MKKLRNVEPPRGLMRLLARLPIALYQLRLGRLLGGRFLLLTHRGRKSGRERCTVIEVMRHDAESDAYIVASGFGPRAQWYQNLRVQPDAVIQVAARRWPVRTRFLEPDEAEREMLDYGRRNPTAARAVAKFVGYEIDTSADDLRAFASLIRIVAFTRRAT